MKPHLADCSAFWESIGVSVEEQQQIAPWAFTVPLVAGELGRAELPEDRQWTFNVISAPASVDKPRQYTPPPAFQAALMALAEFGALRD